MEGDVVGHHGRRIGEIRPHGLGMRHDLLGLRSCPAHRRQGNRPHLNGAANIEDKRTTVRFPKALQRHTLANMRDHLLAIQQIQEALANREYDKAASIAEQRLGMSSLELHGALEVEKFMPAGMQEIGAEMHRAASRFAIEASSAGATGRLGPSLSALARVTQQCVACHVSYRMQ